MHYYKEGSKPQNILIQTCLRAKESNENETLERYLHTADFVWLFS
jgi:hypothetical protein